MNIRLTMAARSVTAGSGRSGLCGEARTIPHRPPPWGRLRITVPGHRRARLPPQSLSQSLASRLHMGDNESLAASAFWPRIRRVAIMLIAYLIAVTIITVIATFPTFWIRKLTAWIARAEAKRQDEAGGGDIS